MGIISTLKHLRIPFSYYLLPVFLFALSLSPNINPDSLRIVFIILHIFLYPSSNGYNSYFDKDEGSIGGLKHPPKVTKLLYYTSMLFFIIAIAWSYTINASFGTLVVIYGLVSMAYSHPLVRLKKYPIISWLVAGIFQGYFTFVMVYVGLNGFAWDAGLKLHVLIPGILTSLILLGSYPMTQIYQHAEDAKRGDQTLSLKLGIRGTFHFTAVCFLIATACFAWFFVSKNQFWAVRDFALALSPVLIYFAIWYSRVLKDESAANYTWTMWLNRISATALNVFFIHYFIKSTQILQVLGFI
nr:UbiA family prenyltransferase [Penaeicola halotolerans]